MALHPQAKAFLAGMEASGAPPLYELTPEEARAATGMITELIGAGPEIANVEDFTIPTSAGEIGARRYVPDDAAATILWIHGGGWVICDSKLTTPSVGWWRRAEELTRRGDELARKRRELPWVAVDKEYRFETDTVVRIRHAEATEAPALEALQRRSSAVWPEYREPLAAHPDAIELPQAFIDNGWVRVALGEDGTPIGFSVLIPGDGQAHELDGLFVEPDHMGRGVGRALIEDAAARTEREGAERMEVTAGPAQGFYEKVGFHVVGPAETRFGTAVRMCRSVYA